MNKPRLIDANDIKYGYSARLFSKFNGDPLDDGYVILKDKLFASKESIDKLPTITLPERGWKFFDDEKPENDDDIILCFRERFPFDKEWKYQVCEAYVSEYEGYLYDEKHHLYFNTYNDWNEGQVIEYIAWMPMPEPPKMEDEA